MNKLLALVALVFALPALSQNVAVCSTAAAGGASYPPCAGTISYVPAANVTAAQLVYDLPTAGGAKWVTPSAVQPTDLIWSNTASPTNASTNWWPVAKVAFATSPVTTPPVVITLPPGPATLSWNAPTVDVNGAPLPATSVLTYDVYQGATKLDATPLTAHAFTTSPLVPGTYDFSVTATNTDPTAQSASTSDHSAVKELVIPAVTITISVKPAAPTNLNATFTTGTAAVVTP